ncbi:DUF6879 family protein [Streptosporangium subroseum]|uniref:DUF6879 family protein n=1 Tax=Streptosporangium subroseum TaxID=106412 RepID=UPI00342D3B3F
MRTYAAGEKAPTFAELLSTCRSSAVHLEIHDEHMTSDSEYAAWLVGEPYPDTGQARAWVELVSGAVARGVKVRRARIISEPVSDYVRWEHAVVPKYQLPAGEVVRWLPRQLASDLALPGNPYWVFDDRLVRFSLFGGDGEVRGHQFTEDPDVIKLCASAFEAVWERATPHEKYLI